MPRISIYLPDDLADQLKEVGPSTPTSQVVQEALRRHLGAGSAPNWARPPGGAGELLAAATEKLTKQAHTDYQAGYICALETVPNLEWADLTGFARSGYDLKSWIEPWCNGINFTVNAEEVTIPDLLKILAPALGDAANPCGFSEFSFRRTNAFERGFGDGLRDAYEFVEHGTTSSVEDTSSTGAGSTATQC